MGYEGDLRSAAGAGLPGGCCVPVTPLGTVAVGPGEAIHIRSLEVLMGIGVQGIPRQRAVALAVEDYGAGVWEETG